MLSLTEFGELSDHTPIFADMEPYGAVMSWNMLTRCNKEPVNNAWAITESIDDYRTRLKKVAEAVAETAASYGDLSLITLQEVPCAPRETEPEIPEPGGAVDEQGKSIMVRYDYRDYFLTQLWEALDKKGMGSDWAFEPESPMRMGTSFFGNLTLYRRDVFLGASAEIPPELKEAQNCRVLVTDLTPVDSNLPPIRVGNVHLKYYKPKHPHDVTTIEELTAMLNTATDQKPVMLIGDFNRSWSKFGELPDHVARVNSLATGKETRRKSCEVDIDYALFGCWPGDPTAVWPGSWVKRVTQEASLTRNPMAASY